MLHNLKEVIVYKRSSVINFYCGHHTQVARFEGGDIAAICRIHGIVACHSKLYLTAEAHAGFVELGFAGRRIKSLWLKLIRMKCFTLPICRENSISFTINDQIVGGIGLVYEPGALKMNRTIFDIYPSLDKTISDGQDDFFASFGISAVGRAGGAGYRRDSCLGLNQ